MKELRIKGDWRHDFQTHRIRLDFKPNMIHNLKRDSNLGKNKEL